MKGSSWFPRWECVGHPLHAHAVTHARTHARYPRDADRRSPRFQHSFERRSRDRSLSLVAPAHDTHVTLWRVVVPRGAPEPPQPPAPSATDPLHWSYAPWGTPPPPPPRHPGSILQHHQHTAPPPAKRALSESDDCDDAFSEESSKDQCPSPGEADSCQMLSRKKRRGIIEKRRRDRINNSLLELRRLVPSAYEKQGSAKLEKAEILQLTVDHLKVLHSKGLDALAYDPSKFAMDYHNIGFRECAAEVARYLVTVEGLDIQDPLRLRLMSHLQCFAAQRELASKQTSWYPPHGQTVAPGAPGHLQHQQQHQNQHGSLDSTGNSSFDTSCETAASSPSVPSTPSSIPPVSSSQTTLTPLTPVSMSSSASNALYQHHSNSNHHHQPQDQHQQQQSQQTPSYHQTHHHHHPHQAPGYHQNPNEISHQNYSSHHPNSSQVSSQMKPYRPWGAEVAY